MSDAEQTFEYDVFLSHSSKDKTVVKELAERLRSDGLRVWFDDWVIQPGDSIPSLIADGLTQSRILVLCMSGNAFGSDWVTLEHQTIMFRDPMNKSRRFVPIRLDESPIKDILKQFAYVDWQQKKDENYQKLLKACQPKASEKAVAHEGTEESERVSGDRSNTANGIAKINEKFIAGHTGAVRSVWISNDGKRALSGSDDNTVKVWDLESGRCINTLEGHNNSVYSVCISITGKRALSGSADNTVKIWDLESGRCINTLEGHTDTVWGVCISIDRKLALSGSADNTVKIWDLVSGRCINTLEGHTNFVLSVCISQDGKRALSGSYDNTVKIWDLESGRCINTLEGHTDTVVSVCISIDGKRALSGSSDNTVKIWDLESGRCINTLEGHNNYVESVCISQDGKQALSGSSDNTVKIWDLESGRCINTLEGHNNYVWSVCISQDGKRALSGSYDNTVKVWDIDSGRCINTLEGHTNDVWSMCISQDGKRALSGSYDNTVKIWDLVSGRCINTLEGHTNFVLSVCISQDEKRALSGSSDNTVKIWDLESGRCINTLEGHTDTVVSVCISIDGKRALSGSSDNTVKIWDLESGRCINTLEGHNNYVESVCISQDGKQALSGSSDNTVKIWDLESGRCINTLEGHNNYVWSVCISQDGKRALSGSYDNTVKVWDIDSGRCINTLEGHTSAVRSVCISIDGKWALSGSSDNTVKIWDIDSGRCINTLEGHTSAVLNVDFNQVFIFSGSRNGRLLIWHNTSPTLSVDVTDKISSSSYTNAKVLLVGDSGVGKTGLAIRLTEDRFEPTISTDAHWATQLKLPNENQDNEIDREIWLWDFAGQADYRLIHQLFMDETALAILVFNPQHENPFEGLGRWDRDLTRASKQPFQKLLVAGRCDRGGLMIPQSKIDEFLHKRNFTQYFQTSALHGRGCKELKAEILKKIDWESISHRTSPRIFKLLKDEILKLRDEGVTLLRLSELKQQMEMRLPGEEFTMPVLRTVVSLLSGPGVVWELAFGEFILLKPEWINRYAAAVIRSVRELGEIGVIKEDKILTGDLNYVIDYRFQETQANKSNSDTLEASRNMKRLTDQDENIVLRAMHQTLIERGICKRIATNEGMELIFPSYFKQELPDDQNLPASLVTYRFNGFLDEIYATLVVQLCNAPGFKNGPFWKFAADFYSPSEARMGLKMKRLNEGSGEISVYFDEEVSDDYKVMFTEYVHLHLLEKGNNTIRLRHFVCPYCSHPVRDTELAREILDDEGEDAQIICQQRKCQKSFDLYDVLEQKFASTEMKESVQNLKKTAKAANKLESEGLALQNHAHSIVKEASQIFFMMPSNDLGIDAVIEFINSYGEPSGQRIYLVLKTQVAIDDELRHDNILFTISENHHLELWKNQNRPIMLVTRLASDEIHWMNMTEYLQKSEDFRSQAIDAHSKIQSKPIVFNGEPFTANSLLKLKAKFKGKQERKQEPVSNQIQYFGNILERLISTVTEKERVTQNFNGPVGNVAASNSGEMKAIQHNYASELKQTPAESAKEIQDLLIQLQSKNPTDIQAVFEEKIKSDPTLRDRIKNALMEGGLETMKVIFPLTGIAIETVRGWVDAEGK